jgi:hypothetical protein
VAGVVVAGVVVAGVVVGVKAMDVATEVAMVVCVLEPGWEHLGVLLLSR